MAKPSFNDVGKHLRLGASFGIGEQNEQTIRVGVRICERHSRQDLADPAAVFAYLSDSPEGLGLASEAPDGGWGTYQTSDVLRASAGGEAVPTGDPRTAYLVTNREGEIYLRLTHSKSGTFYLVLVMPDGMLIKSKPIEFEGPDSGQQ